MLIANVATYPPRRALLADLLDRLTPQVDRVNMVLNEYDHIPEELDKYQNLNPILPEEDMKDVGKFYPDTTAAQYVFMIDDDIVYPQDYVAKTIDAFEGLELDRAVGAYHGSIYYRPSISLHPRRLWDFIRYRPIRIARYRRIVHFRHRVTRAVAVEQIGTGTAIMRPEHIPPYEFMRGSEGFSDVRFARWCFEKDIAMVCRPRPRQWFGKIQVEHNLFRSVTRQNPEHVAEEIWRFAFKAPLDRSYPIPHVSR